MEGKFHWRSCSISSAPMRTGRTISITVRARPEGFLASHLVSCLEPGAIIRPAAPTATSCCRPPPEKILFLVASRGVTPVTAMLRTLDRRGTMTDLTRVCPDWRERASWACGPTPMLDACEEHWEQAGPEDELHLERFILASTSAATAPRAAR